MDLTDRDLILAGLELRITHHEQADRCAAPTSAATRSVPRVVQRTTRRRHARLLGRPGCTPEADHQRVVTAPRSDDHVPPCPYFGGDRQLYTASGVGRITDVTETRQPYQRLPTPKTGANARVALPHSAQVWAHVVGAEPEGSPTRRRSSLSLGSLLRRARPLTRPETIRARARRSARAGLRLDIGRVHASPRRHTRARHAPADTGRTCETPTPWPTVTSPWSRSSSWSDSPVASPPVS
jgi:hypothetical protein